MHFGVDNMAGKFACKTELQKEFGLEANSEAPLIVFINRITDQKMADVVAAALPEVIAVHSASCWAMEKGILKSNSASRSVATRSGLRSTSATKSRWRIG
jgi:hypothetical protein